MELTSDDAMKQSLRLVKDVSLSMSWNAESLPAERDDVEMSGFGGRCIIQKNQTKKTISSLRLMAALGNYNY